MTSGTPAATDTSQSRLERLTTFLIASSAVVTSIATAFPPRAAPGAMAMALRSLSIILPAMLMQLVLLAPGTLSPEQLLLIAGSWAVFAARRRARPANRPASRSMAGRVPGPAAGTDRLS